MPLIVETGAGLTDADSYVTLAEADEYHAERLNSAWSAATTERREACLRLATEYIDTSYSFVSTRKTSEQALEYPRLLSIGIPVRLKKAVMMLAAEALAGPLLPSQTTAEIKRERRKVGELETETEYADTVRIDRYPAVTLALAGLGTKRSSGVSVGRLTRG